MNFKLNLGFGYFKNRYKGKNYKKVKTFKNEKEANTFADTLTSKCRSKRHPPIVKRVELGWKFGHRFRVCVPKDVKVKTNG